MYVNSRTTGSELGEWFEIPGVSEGGHLNFGLFAQVRRANGCKVSYKTSCWGVVTGDLARDQAEAVLADRELGLVARMVILGVADCPPPRARERPLRSVG